MISLVVSLSPSASICYIAYGLRRGCLREGCRRPTLCCWSMFPYLGQLHFSSRDDDFLIFSELWRVLAVMSRARPYTRARNRPSTNFPISFLISLDQSDLYTCTEPHELGDTVRSGAVPLRTVRHLKKYLSEDHNDRGWKLLAVRLRKMAPRDTFTLHICT